MTAGLYSKAIVAVLSASLVAAQTVLSKGGPITSSDWLTIADAALGAVAVYAVPNATQDVARSTNSPP